MIISQLDQTHISSHACMKLPITTSHFWAKSVFSHTRVALHLQKLLNILNASIIFYKLAFQFQLYVLFYT